MTTRKVKVEIPTGLETKPVAMLVRTASEFDNCSIYLENEIKKVNAKSIMGMMTLGLIPGDEITVSAHGENEESAVSKICECLGAA